jgi:hypothetical protein
LGAFWSRITANIAKLPELLLPITAGKSEGNLSDDNRGGPAIRVTNAAAEQGLGDCAMAISKTREFFSDCSDNVAIVGR